MSGGDLNPYRYAANTPVIAIDPTGLFAAPASWTQLLSGIASVVGGSIAVTAVVTGSIALTPFEAGAVIGYGLLSVINGARNAVGSYTGESALPTGFIELAVNAVAGKLGLSPDLTNKLRLTASILDAIVTLRLGTQYIIEHGRCAGNHQGTERCRR